MGIFGAVSKDSKDGLIIDTRVMWLCNEPTYHMTDEILPNYIAKIRVGG